MGATTEFDASMLGSGPTALTPRRISPEIEQALDKVRRTYPQDIYNKLWTGKHEFIAETVKKYLPNGGKIIDYGCGPGDKTAMLAQLGYEVSGYDAYVDDWYSGPGILPRMHAYLTSMGVRHCTDRKDRAAFMAANGPYDLLTMLDMIEHVPGSPRELLIEAIEVVREQGYVVITVPNAGNLRKRIALLVGKTNYAPYSEFFLDPQVPWHGHTREYVRSDLETLAKLMNLEPLEIRAADFMLWRAPPRLRRPFRALTSALWPSVKDSWIFVGRKPKGWRAADLTPAASGTQFS